MPHKMLSDKHWIILQQVMLSSGRVYKKPAHLNTMEGILFRMRVDCPWRDLPEEFGEWSSIIRRFNLWSKKDVLLKIFKALIQDPDTEWELLDESYVKAHQHSAGAGTNDSESIGMSRGGKTSKIHLAVDSYGLPIEFIISGGKSMTALWQDL